MASMYEMKTDNMCEMDQKLTEELAGWGKTKYKKQTTNSKPQKAMIIKIITKEQKIVIDQMLEDISLEELREEIPDHEPRYVLYSISHKYDDGRVVYPLYFIFYSPEGCNPNTHMMYAASRDLVKNKCAFTKYLEFRDLEMLTEETLK